MVKKLKNLRKIFKYSAAIFAFFFVIFSGIYIGNHQRVYGIAQRKMSTLRCVSSICVKNNNVKECINFTTPTLVRVTTNENSKYMGNRVSFITVENIAINCHL